MTRDLNSRQTKFAHLVAGGKTLVGAYRIVYEPGDPKAMHVFRNARRLAAHPEVKARIRQFQELFNTEDAEAIQHHAISVAHRLSISANNERVRLAAAELLFEISVKLEAAHDAAPPQQDRASAELRRLYRRMAALGDREKFNQPVGDKETDTVT